MNIDTKVGSKGQVVIEKSIRDRLGIEPGYRAVQRVVGNRVEIRFFPPDHEESLRGSLAEASREKVARDADSWHEARERAWQRAGWIAEGRGEEESGDE